MPAKRISQIALLASLSIVLRFAFGAFPNIKPITAIFLVSLIYLPLVDGLLVMAITMVGSGFLFGMSSAVGWQVLSFAIVMVVWRYVILPVTNKCSFAMSLQSILAGIAAFIYGFLISIPSAAQFGANLWVYWLNGLTFDALHALSTVFFYPIIYSIFRRLYHEKNAFSS